MRVVDRPSPARGVRYPPGMASPRKPSDDPGPAKAGGSGRKRAKPEVVGLLGVGLDGQDGHTRITKGDDFVLYGGSAETHEKMQDFTLRLTEKLQKKGKRIRDADPRELRDIAGDLES